MENLVKDCQLGDAGEERKRLQKKREINQSIGVLCSVIIFGTYMYVGYLIGRLPESPYIFDLRSVLEVGTTVYMILGMLLALVVGYSPSDKKLKFSCPSCKGVCTFCGERMDISENYPLYECQKCKTIYEKNGSVSMRGRGPLSTCSYEWA